MRRREFIGLAAGAAIWSSAAQAQRHRPFIGFMDLGGVAKSEIMRGLSDNGFFEGRDIVTENTWANLKFDDMKSHAAYFVQKGASLIISNNRAAYAAKEVTQSVPIVFLAGDDPVASGLVQSLHQPGGNLTGVSMLFSDLVAKRIELMRDLVPTASAIAYLGNPTMPITERETRDLQSAASALGVSLAPLLVSNGTEIDEAFKTAARNKIGALLVSGELLFWVHRVDMAKLALQHRIPTIYAARNFAEAGGLMSFGTRQADGWYTMGVYAARILKGEKPANLPVQQVTKTELVLNLKTAKEMGLALPTWLLARADEVIE